MCKREMTLGEEIIELATRGIDTPTVERMYRKYIEMTADKKSKEAMAVHCINDEPAITEFVNAIFGAQTKLNLKNAEVGDRTVIKLAGFGEFAATVHKVTDDKVMIIFDDYIAKRPMNESDINKGGFEASDLNEWLHTEVVEALPCSIREWLIDITIPTIGEMFGWDDEWYKNHFEADYDKQLPLMKQRRNRVAYYANECECGWLRNAVKKDFSSALFAGVGYRGDANYFSASSSFGVRPVLWLVK